MSEPSTETARRFSIKRARVLGYNARQYLLRLPLKAASAPHIARNAALCLVGGSDYSRWSNQASLEQWWEERTKRMAAYIPAGARVIEFGAGSCRLRAHLDASCVYMPSDLVDRGPGTIICDLNRRPLPELAHLRPDVAVFAGVLEYLRDLDTVAAWLARLAATCVVSYDCFPGHASLVGRLRERYRRLYYGYQNNYTEQAVLELFRAHGFVRAATDAWTTQRIFVLENRRPPSNSRPAVNGRQVATGAAP